VTLGYRREKKRLVADPRRAQSKESVHIRGAGMISIHPLSCQEENVLLIDNEMSSTGETKARTWGYLYFE
jgi:hypothetical protein